MTCPLHVDWNMGNWSVPPLVVRAAAHRAIQEVRSNRTVVHAFRSTETSQGLRRYDAMELAMIYKASPTRLD
jgi:hypothetical protein